MRQYKKIFFLCLLFLLFSVIPAGALDHPPKNGVLRQYYANGQLRFEGRYKDGHAVRTRKFYENGRLEIEYRYKDGKLYLSRTFYEDGQLKSIWSRKTGISKNYYSDGRLKSETKTSLGKQQPT